MIKLLSISFISRVYFFTFFSNWMLKIQCFAWTNEYERIIHPIKSHQFDHKLEHFTHWHQFGNQFSTFHSIKLFLDLFWIELRFVNINCSLLLHCIASLSLFFSLSCANRWFTCKWISNQIKSQRKYPNWNKRARKQCKRIDNELIVIITIITVMSNRNKDNTLRLKRKKKNVEFMRASKVVNGLK